jgi:hypothetical protein
VTGSFMDEWLDLNKQPAQHDDEYSSATSEVASPPTCRNHNAMMVMLDGPWLAGGNIGFGGMGAGRMGWCGCNEEGVCEEIGKCHTCMRISIAQAMIVSQSHNLGQNIHIHHRAHA